MTVRDCLSTLLRKCKLSVNAELRIRNARDSRVLLVTYNREFFKKAVMLPECSEAKFGKQVH